MDLRARRRASLDTPLYRYPTLSFAAQVLTVVGLGIGRAAIDEVLGMAAGRASVTGAPNLGERIYVQLEIAGSRPNCGRRAPGSTRPSTTCGRCCWPVARPPITR
jgi:hypothetical protein